MMGFASGVVNMALYGHPVGEPVDGGVVLAAIALVGYVLLRSDKHK